MMPMKGARGLASGMLVLAAVCAVPAISAAQDAGTTTEGTTTTTTPPPPPAPPPSDPGTPAGTGEPNQPDEPSTGPAPGTPHEAAGDSGEPTTDLRGAAPAGGPDGGARKAASASVSVGDNFYSPASVSVAVGDTVTWRNNGRAQHSATADDGTFDTGVFGAGASRSHTFTRAGTFSYYCTVHGQAQSGTVRVLAASGGESGGGGGGSGGPSASATGDSEAAAVASPDAAGDSNTLPATGMAAGALALVGLALLASGLFTHGAVRRWFSPL
jgi:plastocyanin